MEQTALRPKPMPGQEPGDGTKPGTTRRPHAARRRGRRLITLLFSVFVGTVLVLSGVGLGTVGATVIGMSKLADMQRQAAARQPARTATPGTPADRTSSAASPTSSPTSANSAAPAGATLGVEAVDAEQTGALIVGVHLPGPGYTAGLVRGDVLLTFGGARVDSATDLARAVARAHPGKEVTVTVRHRSGGFQQFTVVPGFVV
ncbi:PDZ domain-containing protein [Streptomyces sp. 3213]|uniref:PDZ domain-containing protein n=1 Tax=Streptomyces sp. 3213.3 TaxID=1855348 RepID=UPI00089D4D77|nr:PDZ domain-containing protein [Streptomyces sp. 3213.3]SEE67708.1 PDZ domain-containing protein [Streptomyces sp. 3213] [Streptomyces sp. 3213.3]